MVTWMIHHETIRGKEPSQSWAAWTSLYPLYTFTCFSLLNVCYLEVPQTLLDFKLFWTWACHFPSLCCNHSWILQAFPITGLRYQRQEFQCISLCKDFCCQMGVVSCLYQAMSNALLPALYTMFFWHLFLLLLYNVSIASYKEQPFSPRCPFVFFCSFSEILSFPVLKVKRIYKNRKMNNKLRDLSQSATHCCE